jgi:hypothetical protein
MNSAEDLVRAHVDAFNRRDLSALVNGLAADVVWSTGADVFRGRTSVRKFLADAVRGLLPQLRLATIVADETRVACEFHETYHHAGENHEVSIAAFFEFAGGVITRVKV